MSEHGDVKIVYDCNVYLQFLLNENGPSGRCVRLAFDGQIRLFVSSAILDEIKQLPEKPFCRSHGITPAVIEAFIFELLPRTVFVTSVPNVFQHPIDPDDSDYINLAIAVDAKLVVSRDNHLLNLMNPAKPWSADFRQRFPEIRVLQPQQFLAEWAEKNAE